MYLFLIVLIRSFFIWHFLSTQVEGVEASITVLQSNSTNNDTRIIGGHPIGIEAAPWQVAIIYNGVFECGGSVLSENLVMTAAHCVQGTKIKNFKIRAGSKYFRKGGQVRTVSKAVINGSFNPRTYNHDIAIFKLHQPLEFNMYVRPVRIASHYQPSSKHATVTGWGLTREQNYNPPLDLRAVRVDFITLNQCQRHYKSEAIISENMVCAGASNGGRDACQGDSGGPLVHNGVQYGIVSFGIGCARAHYPGVYTSVAMLKHWIAKVVASI